MQFGIGMDGDSNATIAAANEPVIRLFVVPLIPAGTPQSTIEPAPANAPLLGSWQVCTPDTLIEDGSWKGFSAVAYYFGQNINKFTKQPVGLISTNWGGTVAQAWTSIEGLKSSPLLATYATTALTYQKNVDKDEQTYQTVTLPAWQAAYDKLRADVDAPYQASLKDWRDQVKEAQAGGKPFPPMPIAKAAPRRPGDPTMSPNVPTVLYNGMIAPIVPYGIKGVIWYQGESNASAAVQYGTLFPAMITDWRNHWGEGNFPFLFVQLANFLARMPDPTDTWWPALRESQRMALALPNTGMATTIDIGNGKNIHPSDKWDVAMRLALAGEHVAYGANNVYSGPMYKSMSVEGPKVHLVFDNIGAGLVIGKQPDHYKPTGDEPYSSTVLQGFSIAGDDNKFYWADAAIDGAGVIVSSASVPKPVSVRYAWADNPAANLYNKEGLPASPFRTDSLPIGENLPLPARVAPTAAAPSVGQTATAPATPGKPKATPVPGSPEAPIIIP